MSSSFCGVNLNGIEGLLTSVSRCYLVCELHNVSSKARGEQLTTMSVSLRRVAVALSDRH